MKAVVTILWVGLAAVLLLAGAAGARDHERGDDHRWGRWVRAVPEFDAAAAGVIATLLVGGGIVVARRRRR